MPAYVPYGPRVGEALKLAADDFAGVERKGTGRPYLSHLLHVAAMTAEHGGDEDQIVAAVLHDTLEDIPHRTAADLEDRFGRRVRLLVEALTDSTEHPKPPWRERKERYVAGLRHKGADVKLISACDKLHNATSIVRGHGRHGAAIWDRFSAKAPAIAWYYRALVDALGDGWDHPVLDELDATVRRLEAAARG